MNAAAHTQEPSEKDPVQEHRGNPRLGTVRQEDCSDEQIPRYSIGPNLADDRAFETYVGGAGI